MSTIKVKTSDNVVFEIDSKMTRLSSTIKSLLEREESNESFPKAIEPIEISNVNSEIFRIILEWMEYHKDDEDPNLEKQDEKSRMDSDSMPKWDKKFLDYDNRPYVVLFQLIMAASYLDIKALKLYTTKMAANLLKDNHADYQLLKVLPPEKKTEDAKEKETDSTPMKSSDEPGPSCTSKKSKYQ